MRAEDTSERGSIGHEPSKCGLAGDFEQLLAENRGAVERFVRFKLSKDLGSEDVLQEVYLAAFAGFQKLKNRDSFKAWLIGIARNKVNDRLRALKTELSFVPIDEVPEERFTVGIRGRGIKEYSAVEETMNELSDRDSEILRLYYFLQLPQADIATRLKIPVGTVKSRLHHAKESFRGKYLESEQIKTAKGEKIFMTTYMNQKKYAVMPEMLPQYSIEKSELEPFEPRWEELMGWFIVPRVGEKLNWAMYDFPERKLTESVSMEVTGRINVHGIEGVEIKSLEYDPILANSSEGNPVERTFAAQLTDTHSRFLFECHSEDGVKVMHTFLDGDGFLDNWGFGEDNCGNCVYPKKQGIITREGSNITCKRGKELMDVVGRYTVTVDGKKYDTICVVDVELYNDGVASEQYIDQNGKTVLWRRFNADDWKYSRYHKKWTELLPDNEVILIDGKKFVHWYDCITDYVL